MKEPSRHVAKQVHDVVKKRFGKPPWKMEISLLADDVLQLLQDTTDVAEHHEARANDLSRIAAEFMTFIKQLDEQAKDYHTEWVRERIKNSGLLVKRT